MQALMKFQSSVLVIYSLKLTPKNNPESKKIKQLVTAMLKIVIV